MCAAVRVCCEYAEPLLRSRCGHPVLLAVLEAWSPPALIAAVVRALTGQPATGAEADELDEGEGEREEWGAEEEAYPDEGEEGDDEDDEGDPEGEGEGGGEYEGRGGDGEGEQGEEEDVEFAPEDEDDDNMADKPGDEGEGDESGASAPAEALPLEEDPSAHALLRSLLHGPDSKDGAAPLVQTFARALSAALLSADLLAAWTRKNRPSFTLADLLRALAPADRPALLEALQPLVQEDLEETHAGGKALLEAYRQLRTQ